MKNIITTVLLAIGLVGCTPRVVIKEVKVEVPVPCVEELPTKPSMPLQDAAMSLVSEDEFTLTKKALAEIELRKGYEGILESTLSACKK